MATVKNKPRIVGSSGKKQSTRMRRTTANRSRRPKSKGPDPTVMIIVAVIVGITVVAVPLILKRLVKSQAASDQTAMQQGPRTKYSYVEKAQDPTTGEMAYVPLGTSNDLFLEAIEPKKKKKGKTQWKIADAPSERFLLKYTDGEAKIKSGDFEEATKCFGQALMHAAPKESLERADALFRTAHFFRETIRDYTPKKPGNPNPKKAKAIQAGVGKADATELYFLAIDAVENHQEKEAGKILAKALEEDPEIAHTMYEFNARQIFATAVFLMSEGKGAEADKQFKTLFHAYRKSKAAEQAKESLKEEGKDDIVELAERYEKVAQNVGAVSAPDDENWKKGSQYLESAKQFNEKGRTTTSRAKSNQFYRQAASFAEQALEAFARYQEKHDEAAVRNSIELANKQKFWANKMITTF